MRVCLTGGIACGKSLLSRFLNELGVETIDADDVVHDLIPDPAERKRIAAEVFADPGKRKALEARLHPQVRERISAFLVAGEARRLSYAAGEARRLSYVAGEARRLPYVEEASSPPHLRMAVIPLLFEVHWDADYDIIACVVSSRERQIERMTTTRGYSREEAEARLAAQMPVEEKAAKSHYVIRNDGSAEDLRQEAERFVTWLNSQHPTHNIHG